MSDVARIRSPLMRLPAPLVAMILALPLPAGGNPSALPAELLARASDVVETSAPAPIARTLDDALAAIEARIAALGERAGRATEEADSLRAELDARDMRVQELTAALEASEGQLVEAERQLSDANGVIRALRDRIGEIEERVESLYMQLTNLPSRANHRDLPVQKPATAVDSIGGLLAELDAQRIRHGTLIPVPGEQLFGFDSRDVKADARPLLLRIAELLTFYDDRTVVIIGHTDASGDPSYNEHLSFERAEAVKRFMVDELGLHASRIQTIGAGQSRPIASNSTPAGRQANRRVEIVIHDGNLAAEVRADPDALGLP